MFMNIVSPIISVIMSVYSEEEEWMYQSIESILAQTYTDFEFIIINDNPSRELNRLVLDCYSKQDDRILIINNEENIGLTKSLNKGLSVARGEYIARMDADDISAKDRFEKQIRFFESHPDYIVCGSNIQKFGDVDTYVRFSDDWMNLKLNFLIPNPTSSPIAHPSVMIRASILRSRNIQYDEEYKVGQDYELWSRLMFEGKFSNIQEPLLSYRVSSAQISSKQIDKQLLVLKRVCPKYINRYLKEEDIDIDCSSAVRLFQALKSNQKLYTPTQMKFLTSILCYQLIYLHESTPEILLFLLSRKYWSLRFRLKLLYRYFR